MINGNFGESDAAPCFNPKCSYLYQIPYTELVGGEFVNRQHLLNRHLSLARTYTLFMIQSRLNTLSQHPYHMEFTLVMELEGLSPSRVMLGSERKSVSATIRSWKVNKELGMLLNS